MTIADRIRIKRNELQISQTELAIRAGYSDRTAISKFENAGNDITMKQVKRVATALGVSTAYLMGWENPNPVATGHTPSEALIAFPPGDNLNEESLEFARLFQDASEEDRALVMGFLRKKQPNS